MHMRRVGPRGRASACALVIMQADAALPPLLHPARPTDATPFKRAPPTDGNKLFQSTFIAALYPKV